MIRHPLWYPKQQEKRKWDVKSKVRGYVDSLCMFSASCWGSRSISDRDLYIQVHEKYTLIYLNVSIQMSLCKHTFPEERYVWSSKVWISSLNIYFWKTGSIRFANWKKNQNLCMFLINSHHDIYIYKVGFLCQFSC